MICPAINAYADVQAYSTDQKHYALGSSATLDVFWTDAGSVKHKAKIGVVLMRALEAFAVTGGIPVALSYNATYGRGVVDTYAAGDLDSYFGLTLTYSTAPAAGDLIWVQWCGPNYVGVPSIGAIASLARVEHNAAGQAVKTVATAANAFAVLAGVAMAGDGTIPAGDLWLEGKYSFPTMGGR
jgi:hypothetical protein